MDADEAGAFLCNGTGKVRITPDDLSHRILLRLLSFDTDFSKPLNADVGLSRVAACSLSSTFEKSRLVGKNGAGHSYLEATGDSVLNVCTSI